MVSNSNRWVYFIHTSTSCKVMLCLDQCHKCSCCFFLVHTYISLLYSFHHSIHWPPLWPAIPAGFQELLHLSGQIVPHPPPHRALQTEICQIIRQRTDVVASISRTEIHLWGLWGCGVPCWAQRQRNGYTEKGHKNAVSVLNVRKRLWRKKWYQQAIKNDCC